MNEMKPPSSTKNNYHRNYLVDSMDDHESNDESSFRELPRMGRSSNSSAAVPDNSNASNVTPTNPKGVPLFSTAAFGDIEVQEILFHEYKNHHNLFLLGTCVGQPQWEARCLG
jgi:hypothetical protein